MNLLLRQLWALIRKNLLIICVRKLVSTFIRAIAIPLIIVLVVAYSRNFFHGQEVWGVSSAYPVSSFSVDRTGCNSVAWLRYHQVFAETRRDGRQYSFLADPLVDTLVQRWPHCEL
jgi:hypothetical protein